MNYLHGNLVLAFLAGAAGSATVAAQEAATPAAAPAPETAAVPAAPLHYSNRWRLEVSEGANNAGVIRFRFTPKGGTPFEIPVTLEDGRGEDGVARDIRDTFRKSLDKNVYKIEVDDGEDVLVKLREGPDIAIEIVEQTVKGTRINLDRE
jgi:hypothetical protein